MKLVFFRNRNVKNIVWVFISSIVLALSNWFQLSLLTKNGNLMLLGVFTLSLAVSNPIYQFFNLQLRSLLVTDRDKEFTFSHYYSLRVVTTILVIFLGSIIGFFLFKDIWSIQIFILVFLLYGIDAIIDVFNARLHYDEKLIAVSKSTLSRGLLGLFGFIIGIKLFDNLIFGLLLACLFKSIGFFFYDYILFKKSQEIKSFILNNEIFLLFRRAAPLGIGLLIASLNINLVKYFINYSYGIELQGVYSTFSFVVVVGNITIGAVANVLLPKMAQYFNDKNLGLYKKLHYGLLLLTFFVGLILFLISLSFNDYIVTNLFSNDITEYSYLLNWIFGSAVFTYLTAALGFSLIAVKAVKFQMTTSLICLGVNLLFNIFFLNRASIEMIILFSGIAFFIQFVVGQCYVFGKLRKYD